MEPKLACEVVEVGLSTDSRVRRLGCGRSSGAMAHSALTSCLPRLLLIGHSADAGLIEMTATVD